MVQGSVDIGEAEWDLILRQFATNLRRARASIGLSQEQVAYAAGLSRVTYQRFERGESNSGKSANPTLRSILRLSQVLCTPMSDLIPELHR